MTEDKPKKEEQPLDEQQEGGIVSPDPKGEQNSSKPDQEKVAEDETKEAAEIPLGELKSESAVTKRVCITYGRDQIMNKQVVSLIRELGIDPIVMQDKAHIKKPIAQFYTENPDIAFVVAILSADDWVYPKNGKPNDALMYADQKVVFHLGFWIGRLGRNHVFTLYYDQRSFRWPTEHFDVIYTPLDRNDAWKTELVSRLKASGIPFTNVQE